jgi:hypothetical protein
LKNPVNSCSSDDETSTKTENRSTAFATERTAGHRNRFG